MDWRARKDGASHFDDDAILTEMTAAWNHRTYEVFGTDDMLRVVKFFDKLLAEIGEEL